MSGPVKAKDITSALISTHRSYGWRAEKEALFSPRRIDVLAIAPEGREVVAFEIKVSAQDFRNELKQPQKHLRVMRNCSQFYFVTPVGLIQPWDIPDDCGLIYYQDGLFYTVKPLEGRSTLLCRLEQIRVDEAETELRESIQAAEKRRIRMEFADLIAEEYTHQVDDDLPLWMLPPYPAPLNFNFNIFDAASSVPSVSTPQFSLDEVPF